MSPTRQQELYCAALEIADPGRRRAMLDQACAGDPRMRSELDELLGVRVEAEDFFEECQTAVTRSVNESMEADLADSFEIKGYQLLHVMGEGGCGVVYMAEQLRPVRRRVALKVIKLGMDTRSVIARFEAEQQALALMDHPNIARVLDAGVTSSGRPYFAMDLVHGTKITAYCDAQRLDLRERLKLFVQVCQAIQHAHQKGLIHRDIKPSNIVVASHDGVAVPKVIDFGIAKAIQGRLTDQTLFTPCEHFLGTPAYMSPEQADQSSLDVDTRSDIYSLGVLLYELLTGKTPFEPKELTAAGMDAMRRTLLEKEPPPPSEKVRGLPTDTLNEVAALRRCEPTRLGSMLSRDLDWIAAKALEKDRRHRYETAYGLAADVKRYLENEPVVASPPSRLYRLRKLMRRNRAAFAAGIVVTLALAACSVISTSLLYKEREARRLAEVSEQKRTRLEKETERLGELRRLAEQRQMVLEAASLVGMRENERADALLAQVTNPRPSEELAVMYRELGDWHANHGRWETAAERIAMLNLINSATTSDTTLDDLRYATLLAELNRGAEYERFRQLLLSRYAGTADPIAAERVVKACLLMPASPEMMHALNRQVAVAERSMQRATPDANPQMTAWRAYSLALMAYRKGDHRSVLGWCDKAAEFDSMQSCVMSTKIVRALALASLGRLADANIELIEPRLAVPETVIAGVSSLPRWEGYWFDWVFARIQLREAEALLGRQ